MNGVKRPKTGSMEANIPVYRGCDVKKVKVV
jgi:hypothetical protein